MNMAVMKADGPGWIIIMETVKQAVKQRFQVYDQDLELLEGYLSQIKKYRITPRKQRNQERRGSCEG